MKILAVETSCDETSVAIVKASGSERKTNFKILSNIIASQIAKHEKFGGIVPSLAAREHIKNLPKVMKLSFKEAKASPKEIDYIAVTQGPGLIPCLMIGTMFAKTLSYAWQKQLVAVNHLEGHIYSNWLHKEKVDFPILNLIVSGGHTQLVLQKNHQNFQLIGETRDDAAGEAFDKIARLLGLGFPGGPEIAKLAEKGNTRTFELPRPMIKSKDFDFSFSGLKTAVLNLINDLRKKGKKLTLKQKANLAASFQQAIIDVLIAKTLKAVRKYKVKSILLSGGVSANRQLREQLAAEVTRSFPQIKYFQPEIKLSTDNAVMIAIAAFFKIKKGQISSWQELEALANLTL